MGCQVWEPLGYTELILSHSHKRQETPSMNPPSYDHKLQVNQKCLHRIEFQLRSKRNFYVRNILRFCQPVSKCFYAITPTKNVPSLTVQENRPTQAGPQRFKPLCSPWPPSSTPAGWVQVMVTLGSLSVTGWRKKTDWKEREQCLLKAEGLSSLTSIL